MSFDKLFLPLLDYLNFLVDFALFDGMDRYVLRGNIQLFHLSNFLLGCLFSGFITANWGKFTSKEKVELVDWKFLAYVPMVLLHAVFWQSAVYVASLFACFQHGSIKDAVNVSFGTAAIFLPFLGLKAKALRATEGVVASNFLQRLAIGIVSLLFLVVSFLLPINFFRFAALYYNLTLIQTLWSIAVYVPIALIFRFSAKHFLNSHSTHKTKGERMTLESDMPTDPFIRWQAITIKQMSYSINLIIASSVGSLGYALSLLPNRDFELIGLSKCFFDFGMGGLILSIVVGVATSLNRLKDFRITAKLARGKETIPERDRLRDLTDELGDTTWCLFRWQLGLFIFGFVFLLIAFAIIYKDKLF